MSSAREIKKRIKSVKNTSQITKAMEAVSATKMRKAQETAVGARPFAMAGMELLKNLLSHAPALPAILRERPVKKTLALIITSDKGLAGAFNANVLHLAEDWILEKKKNKSDFSIVCVGKKAKDYFARRGFTVIKTFFGFGDFSRPADTLPVANLVLNGFGNGDWDEVIILATLFRSTLRQDAACRRVLPATEAGLREIVESILPEKGKYADIKHKDKKANYDYEYIFEPTPAEILDKLVPDLLRVSVHHLILESNASEHSARMVAMKSASDNAKELIEDLSLAYNKARQAGITRELTEITAGVEASNG